MSEPNTTSSRSVCDRSKQDASHDGNSLALGTGVGVALGTAIGTAMGNVAVGIGMGIAIGAAFGAVLERRSDVDK